VGLRVKPGEVATGGENPSKVVAGRAGRGQRLPAGASPTPSVGPFIRSSDVFERATCALPGAVWPQGIFPGTDWFELLFVALVAEGNQVFTTQSEFLDGAVVGHPPDDTGGLRR
jgi:hypothetical protein